VLAVQFSSSEEIKKRWRYSCVNWVELSSARAAVTRGPECGKLKKEAVARKRPVKTEDLAYSSDT
jgi:hypothetical protein